MFLKVPSTSPAYPKFMEIKEKIIQVNESLRNFEAKYGAEASASSSPSIAFGACDALQIKEKPEGWKMMGNKWQNLYAPTAKLKDVCKEMSELPRIEWDEICDIVGVESFRTGAGGNGISIIHGMGLAWGTDCVLFEIEKGCAFDTTLGIIEVTETEYEALKAPKQETVAA